MWRGFLEFVRAYVGAEDSLDGAAVANASPAHARDPDDVDAGIERISNVDPDDQREGTGAGTGAETGGEWHTRSRSASGTSGNPGLSRMRSMFDSRPVSCLGMLQIERSWAEFAAVCRDLPQDEFDFDIEYDLKLDKPVRIAILDTGAHQDHDALAGRVTRVRNFVPRKFQSDANEDLIWDSNGHGTFCAALAAGGTYVAEPEVGGAVEPYFQNGVAPFAKLVIGKVLDRDRHGDVEWLIKGVKWACDIDKTDHRRPVNADVICIPGGIGKYHPELRSVIYKAQMRGKIIVCAAGGEEDDKSYNIQYPARFGDVICVGSQSANGQPATFTPAGRELDFLAPGEEVWSAAASGRSTVRLHSGTSVAAPIAAGVCALVLAYAEQLGGSELRRQVSHTAVMREILRRMASNPGHHSALAGYGNLVPYRLLKYGPETFRNEVTALVRELPEDDESLGYVSQTLGPLQPVIHNFNVGAVMTWLAPDDDVIRGLLKPLRRDRVLQRWRHGLCVIFFGPQSATCTEEIDTEVRCQWKRHLELVDLSLPESSNGNDVPGISVTNIVQTYFRGGTFQVDTLILPDFDHVGYYEPDKVFQTLQPRHIVFSGAVPLHYLLDTLMALHWRTPTPDLPAQPIRISCDSVAMSLDQVPHAKLQHAAFRFLDSLITDGKGQQISVYIKQVSVGSSEQDILDRVIPLSSRELCKVLDPNDNVGNAGSNCQAIFFTAEEGESDIKNAATENSPVNQNGGLQTNSDATELTVSCAEPARSHGNTEGSEHGNETQMASDEASEATQVDTERTAFRAWDEIEVVLGYKSSQGKTDVFLSRTVPLSRALTRGYDAALGILDSASFGPKVTCLDLRLPPLWLEPTRDSNVASLRPLPECPEFLLRLPDEAVASAAEMPEDLRSISLSGTLRSLTVKAGSGCIIQEVVLPKMDRLADLEETFACQIWRRCRHIYIPGQVTLGDVLRIIRVLPKGDHSLVIHIQRLLLENKLPEDVSRDFDAPGGLRIVVHQMALDAFFFQMSLHTVKIFYEVCLALSSLTFLRFVKEKCEEYIDHPEGFVTPYNCLRCYESCQTLCKYLSDALEEEHVSGDDSLLHFSPDVFKYDVMTAGIGQARYRRAFQPVEEARNHELPTNVYKSQLLHAAAVSDAVKSGKVRPVTVALLSSGVNAFHSEFQRPPSAPGRRAAAARSQSCPFGETIAGLAYNAVPAETMQTFLEGEDCPLVGTTLAALIAGKTSGAAPFADVVSLKVTSSSSRRHQARAIIGALKWLIHQEENEYLPACDVIAIPISLEHFYPELANLIGWLCSSGKIIVCAAEGPNLAGAHAQTSQQLGYPAVLGDVICVGAHRSSGEPCRGSRRGREVDLLAAGEPLGGLEVVRAAVRSQTGPGPLPIATAHVTGVVAFTLAYAELIGGPSLRQAISNNSVMRELLRQMCTKPGQHDERSGHGCLAPQQVLKHGDTYFKKVVSEITEEYYEISTRPTKSSAASSLPSPRQQHRVTRKGMTSQRKPGETSLAFSRVAEDLAEPRSRSSSFTGSRGSRRVRRPRSRTVSESVTFK